MSQLSCLLADTGADIPIECVCVKGGPLFCVSYDIYQGLISSCIYSMGMILLCYPQIQQSDCKLNLGQFSIYQQHLPLSIYNGVLTAHVSLVTAYMNSMDPDVLCSQKGR